MMKNPGWRKLNNFWKIAIVFCAGCVAIILPGYFKVAGLKKDIVKIEKEINRLRSENDAMRAGIEGLEKDPAAAEEIARKLGWVKKGEVRVHFVQPETKALDAKKKKKKI